MSSEQTALELLAPLYAGARDAEQRDEFISQVSKAFPGHNIFFSLKCPTEEAPGIVSDCMGNQDANDSYNAYYHKLDPTLEAACQLPAGQVLVTDRHIEANTLSRSEFFNDWVLPFGMAPGPNYLAALATEAGRPTATFAVGRLIDGQPLNADQEHLLELLVPHLVNSRALWLKAHRAEGRELQLQETLDRMPVAALVVDQARKIVVANQAVEAFLDGSDGLSLGNGELCVDEPLLGRSLSRAIAEACETGSGAGLSAGGVFLKQREEGRPPLEISVTPLHRASVDLHQAGAAFVFINDPAAHPALAQDVLCATYDLTPSEARLATLLAADHSLAEAADELEVSVHTVRKQLQALFAKTGTHRQSSLVGLLVRSAAALPPSDQ
jgi:DNA-binding CsgD family transcriptional regulator